MSLHEQSVSIVIPVFNRPETVRRAVGSCFAQTQAPLEVIVVDDGSTDSTRDVLGALCREDARLRVIRLDVNRGAQAARIEGIKAARGEWIAFLDSDDELTPDSLEVRLRAAAESGMEPALVYGDLLVERAGKTAVQAAPRLSGRSYKRVLRDLYLGTYDCYFVRKNAFATCGYPTESLPSHQDRDMVLLIAKHFPILHCGAVVAVYHCGSANQITKNMNSLIEGHEKLIEKYADDVVRHCGRARLMLMKAHVFRSKLKRFHRRIQERHRRLASIFPERRHPLRIAHAVYVRAVFTALWTANRTLRMFFSYPEWFTD